MVLPETRAAVWEPLAARLAPTTTFKVTSFHSLPHSDARLELQRVVFTASTLVAVVPIEVVGDLPAPVTFKSSLSVLFSQPHHRNGAAQCLLSAFIKFRLLCPHKYIFTISCYLFFFLLVYSFGILLQQRLSFLQAIMKVSSELIWSSSSLSPPRIRRIPFCRAHS